MRGRKNGKEVEDQKKTMIVIDCDCDKREREEERRANQTEKTNFFFTFLKINNQFNFIYPMREIFQFFKIIIIFYGYQFLISIFLNQVFQNPPPKFKKSVRKKKVVNMQEILNPINH
ncbi:hypothetical protein PPERSA_04629 [Pseudocohnilembus persalinus]|uniref:Transmembrane protein n=1 Tax=Pseudocohnilembus persalinus TaxID=266149 RepID=A0A0V0QP34_PSEPJ|nr:hypothetical protein PPERSA_04629 [Pseudocohnilembus persalinus]|eukprot:KRX03834.1 hypothetical protein PPERSA_04629 [Pseudocohnilembus persalinus]